MLDGPISEETANEILRSMAFLSLALTSIGGFRHSFPQSSLMAHLQCSKEFVNELPNQLYRRGVIVERYYLGSTKKAVLFQPKRNVMDSIGIILRKKIGLLLIWILMSGIMPNRLFTEAMKASPHPFVVEQDDEEIRLKIKGDELQHWVTDDEGKYSIFVTTFWLDVQLVL